MMEKKWKFRGFDSEGRKGWVYGDLVHNKDVYLRDRVMVGGYEVVPESVGLFTGLKDSNGTEIYQGDVIRISYNGKIVYDAPVIWHSGYAAFMLDEGDRCFSPIPNIVTATEILIEVIGNVYHKEE